jgi:hypothetical protein
LGSAKGEEAKPELMVRASGQLVVNGSEWRRSSRPVPLTTISTCRLAQQGDQPLAQPSQRIGLDLMLCNDTANRTRAEATALSGIIGVVAIDIGVSQLTHHFPEPLLKCGAQPKEERLACQSDLWHRRK